MSQYILKRKAIDAVYAGIKLYHDEHRPQKVVYDYILDVVGEIETEDVAPVVYCKDCKECKYSYQHYWCLLLEIEIADAETFYCKEGCKR